MFMANEYYCENCNKIPKLDLKIKMVAFYAEWAFRDTYCRDYLFYANMSRFNLRTSEVLFFKMLLFTQFTIQVGLRSIAAYTNIK